MHLNLVSALVFIHSDFCFLLLRVIFLKAFLKDPGLEEKPEQDDLPTVFHLSLD